MDLCNKVTVRNSIVTYTEIVLGNGIEIYAITTKKEEANLCIFLYAYNFIRM